ncbi:hypothetical protein ACYPKM_02205 [Pseudomonas aeruginosa]
MKNAEIAKILETALASQWERQGSPPHGTELILGDLEKEQVVLKRGDDLILEAGDMLEQWIELNTPTQQESEALKAFYAWKKAREATLKTAC